MRTLKTLAAAGLLLGTTSVMAQTKSDEGKFTFNVPEAFEIICTDADVITEVEEMKVADPGDLKDAPAVVTCDIKTTRSKWYLYLDAKHGGKMLKTKADPDDPDEFLRLDNGNDPAYDGILGMWVEFLEASAHDGTATTDLNIGTIKADGTISTSLIANGDAVSDNGNSFTPAGSTAKINLASVIDGDNDIKRFAARDGDGKGRSSAFTIGIHGAFVTPNEDEIISEGEHIETIEIYVSAEQI